MASVHLELKDQRATQKTRLIAVLTDGRAFKRKLYTGISIKPKHWGKERRVLSADPNSIAFNKELNRIKKELISAYLEAKGKGIEISLEYLKSKVWPTPIKVFTFWDVWKLFCDAKRKETKEVSFKKYVALESHLKEFEGDDNRPLSFDLISHQWMIDFRNYLFTIKNLNTQTASKYLSTLKVFLNWSINRKHSNNSDFKAFRNFQQPDSPKVIITESEMDKLEKFNFKEKNYLKNVRELFVLSCETGLRFSDYTRIKPEHIKDDHEGTKILSIRQSKTNETIEIPLNRRALKVIKGIFEGSIKPISNQKMNDYVKELCKLVGIDEAFEHTTFKGKEKTVSIKKKFELITTHTGRRTFATNLLLKGNPPEIVMHFTGHKDYKSFIKYVNIPKATQKKAFKKAMFKGQMRIA